MFGMFLQSRALVWFFRLGLFVGLLSAVLTVIYFTPVPDLYFASCDRPCHELDWPMICRFRLVLESHHSMGPWCGDCPRNVSHCFRPGCILGDGSTHRLLAANRQLPGPPIQVCENDILVVDVVNRLPGQGVSVHWRGQPQTGSPYMDGVPMVTQCPISSFTTYQYKFRASRAGTHLWHSHTGNEVLDGLFGALVVRKADRVEEFRQSYDRDLKDHLLVFSVWSNSILINGVASHKEELMPRVVLEPGLRHRIRLAHAGPGCPLYFTVQDHPMTVIFLDGAPIAPVQVHLVKLSQGERMDVVVAATEGAAKESFKIRVNGACTSAVGEARLAYSRAPSQPRKAPSTPPTQGPSPNVPQARVLTTSYDEDCSKEDILCLTELHSRHHLPASLSQPSVDLRLILPFDYVQLAAGPAGLRELRPRLNNITFLFPPSPLLSQGGSADEVVCTADSRPASCEHTPICECTQVIDIPLHSTVELVLVNKDRISDREEHVFHLHGYTFHVVALDRVAPGRQDDHPELSLKRNLVDPVAKDTISIPRDGVAVLRFKADNPGMWLLHEETASEWASGLDVLLRVGSRQDLPPVPDNFPKCGSWVGPQFFLI